MSQNTTTLDLLNVCEGVCKMALALVDECEAAQKAAQAAQSPIVLEKVAAAAVPDDVIADVVDALDARGMVLNGGRDKLAAALRDPRELAETVLQLAQFIRPSSEAGVPASLSSLSSKAASLQSDSPTSEEDEERAGWAELARDGL